MGNDWRIHLRAIGVGVGVAVLLAGCGRAAVTGSGVAESSDSAGASAPASSGIASSSAATAAGSTAAGSAAVDSTEAGSAETDMTQPSVTDTTGAGTTADARTCATTWATDEQASQLSVSNGFVTSIVGESSDCIDRVVIGIDRAEVAPGYLVGYVPQVQQDGSGLPVPLRGKAFLQVVVDAPDYDIDAGEATLSAKDKAELLDPARFTAVRQMSSAGSFEGQSTFGIGVTDRLPFAVTSTVNADGSAQVVIEIARG